MTTHFIDCPKNGATEIGWRKAGDLFVRVTARRENKWRTAGWVALCQSCQDFHPGRVIDVRGFGRDGSACGPKCLAGRTSCDCKCAGRCHGQGFCSCPVAA